MCLGVSVTVMDQTLYVHSVLSVFYEKHIKEMALNMLPCYISKMETIKIIKNITI
jgi:hypothetical protein